MLATKRTQHPYFRGLNTPRVLAHRGLLTTEMREQGVVDNTRAAFTAARAAGAEYIETDCHVTSDGVVVLFHDYDLRRVANDARQVSQVSASELKSLLADRGGLLTLADALDAFPDTRINLDVKAEGAAEAAGRLVSPHVNRVLLTSFVDARRKRALRAAAAGRRDGALPATSPGRFALTRLLMCVALNQPGLARRAMRGLDALQIPERQWKVPVLTPRLLRAAHTFGVEVHVWTINSAKRMEELIVLGVDGIVTDRADLAINTLQR